MREIEKIVEGLDEDDSEALVLHAFIARHAKDDEAMLEMNVYAMLYRELRRVFASSRKET